MVENIVFQDNIVFYEFLKRILYLYKKITIGTKTMYMDKYKIKDLVNYSPILFSSSLFREAEVDREAVWTTKPCKGPHADINQRTSTVVAETCECHSNMEGQEGNMGT